MTNTAHDNHDWSIPAPIPMIQRDESLEEKVNRIDHNLQVLLDTVQQVVGSFEKNPMAKMFMNRMGK